MTLVQQSAADDSRPNPVTVQILDKEYRIACTEEEQHGLMDCARLLDRRMREVRQNGRVIGADRIAVMAALNLIYELMQQRGGATLDSTRLAAMQQRLADALDAGVTPAASSASASTSDAAGGHSGGNATAAG